MRHARQLRPVHGLLTTKPDSRTQIINRLIQRNCYSRYLEIGVDNGLNFAAIVCPVKVGVDPSPRSAANVRMTSDAYFTAFPSQRFDIIFVDGLHHAEQVHRDIVNGLNVLAPGGIIVCHDMLPFSEAMQIVPRTQGFWTGDCWKAFVQLRARGDIVMYTCRTAAEPVGMGFIRVGAQEPLIVDAADLTYANYVKNQKLWMNVVDCATIG